MTPVYHSDSKWRNVPNDSILVMTHVYHSDSKWRNVPNDSILVMTHVYHSNSKWRNVPNDCILLSLQVFTHIQQHTESPETGPTGQGSNYVIQIEKQCILHVKQSVLLIYFN